MNIQFVDFKECFNEKHVGIITINFNNLIYLRYKVYPAKNGPGYYAMPPSYKISEQGVDEYLPAFVIDSNFTKTEIDAVVKRETAQYFVKKSNAPTKSASSVFDQETQDFYRGATGMAPPAQASLFDTSEEIPF